METVSSQDNGMERATKTAITACVLDLRHSLEEDHWGCSQAAWAA